MKKILISSILVLSSFLGIFASHADAQLRVLRPSEGGTGFGTTSAANIGNCLKVSTTSPFLIWNIDTCGGGGSLAIGSAVSGSTNYANLYVDGSGNLANGFQLFDSTGTRVFDLDTMLAYDLGGIYISADLNTRQLVRSTGATSFNWDSIQMFDTNGTGQLSIDGANRILFASDGTTPQIDWTGTYNASSPLSFSGLSAIFGAVIKDSSNNSTIETFSRILYASDGTTRSIDWTDTLNPYASLSFAGQHAYFGAAINSMTTVNDSLDPNSRILYGYDGTTKIIDWHADTSNTTSATYWFDSANGNRLTGDGTGLTGIIATNAINANNLYDTAGTPVLAADGVNRILYAPDGVTHLISWANTPDLPATISFDNGSPIVSTAIFDTSSQLTLDTNSRQLFDVSGVKSGDYGSRQFFAPDGTTKVFDWSGTGTTAVMNFVASSSAGPAIYMTSDFVDNLGYASLDTTSRAAFDSGQIQSLSWNSRILNSSSAGNVLDWHTDTSNTNSATYWFDSANGNRITGDGSGLSAIKVDQVFRADFSTQVIDGDNMQLIDINTGQATLDWNGHYLLASGTKIIDWTSQSSNGASAIYWFDSNNGNRITGDGSGLTNVGEIKLDNTAHNMWSVDANAPGGTTNLVLGYLAGGASATGNYNAVVSAAAGGALTTASNNALFGYSAASQLQDGSNNSVFGYAALNAAVSSVGNTAIGYTAAVGATSDYNTVIGYNAATNLTTGGHNIFIGASIDAPSITDNNQLNIGNLIYGTGLDGSGLTISTGNIGIGVVNPSTRLEVDGTVTATGFSGDGSGLTNVGELLIDASRNVSTKNTTAVVTGSDNILIGYQAGNSINAGADNIFLGTSAGTLVVGGGANIAIGDGAGASLVNSSNNLFLGELTGTLATGMSNTFLGVASGANHTTGANNIIIGSQIDSQNPTGDNQLNIGNLIFGIGLDGTAAATSSGSIGIGIKVPAYKLDVDGDVGIPSTLFTAGDWAGSPPNSVVEAINRISAVVSAGGAVPIP